MDKAIAFGLQAVEWAVLLIVAYVLVHFFNQSNDIITGALFLVLGLATKAAKESDACPIPDYTATK